MQVLYLGGDPLAGEGKVRERREVSPCRRHFQSSYHCGSSFPRGPLGGSVERMPQGYPNHGGCCIVTRQLQSWLSAHPGAFGMPSLCCRLHSRPQGPESRWVLAAGCGTWQWPRGYLRQDTLSVSFHGLVAGELSD